MRTLPCAIAVLLLVAAAPPAARGDATYGALRAMRPDGRRLPVTGVELERDALRFRFDSGAFHLLTPVEGRTVGALFVGKGSWRLSPATEAERRHLALASGAGEDFEVLHDEFEELLLLFADDTLEELQLHAAVAAGEPDPRATRAHAGWLERQRERFEVNFHLRLLRDLLNTPGLRSGVFMALVDGRGLPPALAALDPDGADALRVGTRLGGADAVLLVADPHVGGLWYHSDRRAEVERGRALPERRLADARAYEIDTTIARDRDLAGTAIVRLEVLAAGLRVLPLELLPALRLQAASYAPEPAAGAEPQWRELAFVQEAEKEDADAGVIFPEPLAKGARVALRLRYAGDEVLEDAGEKNYFVRARASWYPNLGVFSDPATFALTYRVPAGNQVVSVGRQVEERSEGAVAVSTWRTDHEVQVAGFNYGKFVSLRQLDETSGIEIAVHTNPGTPDIVRQINAFLRSGGGGEGVAFDAESGEFIDTGMGPSLGQVDTSRLAEDAMADGLNSARLFTTYFGPVPQRNVAITQQSEWFFGQSWPTLVFLPYISFLDGTQRQRLGMGAGTADFVAEVGYHELAHQWWGHLVGAATYRDQWIEEGFSEFSAALAVQHVRGWDAYHEVWREARKHILGKYPGNAVAHWQAGPMTQGWRLATQRSPSAAQAMIYSKGGYVLHMLRMLMREGAAPNPDARFIAMMQDFTRSFGGRRASTADLQQVVERHMVPAMNATGDGKMDWFFQQWVYGTDIPRYTAELAAQRDGGQYRISGTIRQEGVPASFRALVPVYVELGRGEFVRIGLVPMVGESSVPVNVALELPKKPRRVLVNHHGEVLARD